MSVSFLHHAVDTAPFVERRQAALRVLLFLLLLLPGGAVFAQLVPGGFSGGSDATADAAQADAALEQQVAEATKELAAVEAELARLNERIAGAADRTEELRQQIAAGGDLAGVADIDIETLSRAELDALIMEQRERVAAQRARILELDAALGALIQAPVQAAQQAPAPAAGAAAGEASAPAPSEAANGAPAAAETLASLRRQIAERRQEVARLRLANNEKLSVLATVERDYERRVLAQIEAFLERAAERLRRLREEEASRSLDEAREAQRQTAFEPQAVRELADEIVVLKEELAEVARRSGAIAEQLQEVSSRLDRIRDDFTVTRDRVEVVGATPAIGRMLRRRLANLPSNAGYRRSAKIRRAEISEVIDRQIDIDEELRQLGDVDTEVDRLLAPLAGSVVEEEFARVRARARELLVEKRNTLAGAHAQYGAVAARLTQLDQAQRALVDQSSEFVAFIEGELMTIPSQRPLHGVPVGDWLEAIGSIFQMSLWRQLLADAVAALKSSYNLSLLVVLAAVLVIGARRVAREEIRRIGPLTRKIRTDGMRLTFIVFGGTMLLAAFWPVLLAGLGWIIQRASVSDLSSSLGGAMVRAGVVLFLFGFFWHAMRSEGLAIRHFRWSEDTVRRIFVHLNWFLPLGTFAIAVNHFLFYAGVPGWNRLSRVLFIASLLLIIVFFWRIMRHRRGGERYADALTEMNDPLSRTRSRWFYLLFAVMLFNGGMSYFGYHYTAMRLDFYFGSTIILLLVLLMLHNLLLRWSTLVQRRLRFNELLKRREELRAAREAADGEVHEVAEPAAVEERELDVVGLGDQARRVVSAALVFLGFIGLYLIWEDLFPALRVLDDIALPFSRTVLIDGIETLQPVSLKDFGVAMLVFAATFIALRNLPGLLEFVLLQRLPIDAGARYATITISRYIIVAVGVITGFSMIGADWSKLQWLIAALGVGLGFGLQEIVANFVSGIILLFERPIRVGDVITLGDTSGTVNKIRIRATTIRNWDQQELVVPNKEFITGRLLNWTLSDPINRAIIPVGVAYGSDVEKALSIMLEVAREHPHVLEEPAPFVVFEKFGASSLDLVLRAYFSGLEYRITSVSEINAEINRRFTEAGIEIPFAQRDVHLSTDKPLDIRLARDPG